MLDLVKEYASKRIDLLKMEAAEKSSLTAGMFTVFAIAIVAGLFFILLLNIGIALLIGKFIGNYGYGLLIVSGFYLLVLIIVLLARRSIVNGVANKIIKSFNEQYGNKIQQLGRITPKESSAEARCFGDGKPPHLPECQRKFKCHD